MTVLIDALAAWGALSLACGGGLLGWCVLGAAADRREGRRVFDEQLRRVSGGAR